MEKYTKLKLPLKKTIITKSLKLILTNTTVFMNKMEATLTEMHKIVNLLNLIAKDIKSSLKQLKKENKSQKLINQGEKLLKEIQNWDELMVYVDLRHMMMSKILKINLLLNIYF